MKRVVVVEDQTILRDLICRLLESYPGIEVVGALADGHEALREINEKKPDIVVLDIMLPQLNGVEVLRQLKNNDRKPDILIFSAFPSKNVVKKVLEAGIEGFIEKDANLNELEVAIEKIVAGQSYFGPRIVDIMREIMINPTQGDSLEELTPRERQVLQLIAESCTSKEIASKLDISVKTADTHRANLMKKLGVHDVAGLTRQALAFGLIDNPRPLS
ncbi:response regulator transcription factor [Ruficoccus amylovorans]|uniref:Response regulator transcription factor n=1 Tax=Ruficoccus amylovorans TaxID=1804625 RepID=A0A842HER8_9BACT|nr:response regulator transcription factor [Ruficoccus amylovorans]MBC2594720.1 response regulator transcription factor [Ruficoccus amylovorans]